MVGETLEFEFEIDLIFVNNLSIVLTKKMLEGRIRKRLREAKRCRVMGKDAGMVYRLPLSAL